MASSFMVLFHLLYPVYETDYHAASVKNGQDVASFRRLLKKQNFTGYDVNTLTAFDTSS